MRDRGNARRAVMRLAMIAAVLGAGCADLGAIEDQCTTSLLVTPAFPETGTEVRVTANIIDPNGGQPTIDWRVRFEQTDVLFTGQGSLEIAFTPTAPGIYSVDMTPSASGSLCPSQHAEINVVQSTPGDAELRLRVTPPLDVGVPPIDKLVMLPTGTPAYALGVLALDPGRETSGTVGRPAYMRFIPDGQPDAVVEAYADATGAFAARIQSAPHHVLIVPNDPAYPPQVVADTPGQGESYTLSTGVAITGMVRAPNGTPLAGAKVQVFMADSYGITVPSTIATSAANGTFMLRAFAANGTDERVVVTPPASSGLPRLDAGSAGFDFTNAISINYGASLVTRDVSGTDVVRGGALANAKVTIVGTIPFATAGSIVAGATAVSNGYVRIPMIADASGALPSVLVPAGDLFAVVEPANAPGDAAVVPFDTTSAVPATITAPAMVPFSTTVKLDTTSVAGGAQVELVPIGALGTAGIGPTIIVANESGVISGSLASGAIYEARFSDPSRRAGPWTLGSIGATTIANFPNIYLPEPLLITGSLAIIGSTNRIAGAAVQVLCSVGDGAIPCEGVERDRPIGEDASDSQGSFSVVVPRPAVPL